MKVNYRENIYLGSVSEGELRGGFSGLKVECGGRKYFRTRYIMCKDLR